MGVVYEGREIIFPPAFQHFPVSIPTKPVLTCCQSTSLSGGWQRRTRRPASASTTGSGTHESPSSQTRRSATNVRHLLLSIYPCAVVDTGCSRSDIGNDRDPWLRRGVAAPPTCTMNPPAGKFVVSNMPNFTAFHIDRCNARAVRSGMPASSLLCAASSSGRRRESSACSSLATLRATGNPFSTTPPFRFAAASLSSSSASTVSLQLQSQY